MSSINYFRILFNFSSKDKQNRFPLVFPQMNNHIVAVKMFAKQFPDLLLSV